MLISAEVVTTSSELSQRPLRWLGLDDAHLLALCQAQRAQARCKLPDACAQLPASVRSFDTQENSKQCCGSFGPYVKVSLVTGV